MQFYVVLVYKSPIISPMSLWECVLHRRVYWKWYQDTNMMLQMSLKEMSYFSYKPLSSSCHCLSTPLSRCSVPHRFVVISYLTLMKGKQPLLITVTPWELGNRMCVMWSGVMRHNIVASPPIVCSAESEAVQVQRCAAPHSVMENYYNAFAGVFHLYVKYCVLHFLCCTQIFNSLYFLLSFTFLYFYKLGSRYIMLV